MKQKLHRTVRTSAGLCDALFQEFDMLRSGRSDVHRASAVAKLAVQIINTKRLEMDAVMFLRGGVSLAPLSLKGGSLRIGQAES